MVSQGVGGHEGYSGTPLWKIQQQSREAREAALQESLQYVSERKPIVPPNVLVEAVSQGGASGKFLSRHVIVKCLRKVADRMKIEFPTTGIFQNRAPMGLFALFDGQSCAGEPGPAAAEYCARNFHKKLMENLASLPSGCTSETFVKAAMVKSFEDLDKEVLEQPDVRDGCGAAIALVLGECLFTAVLGACDGVLCEVAEGPGGGIRPIPLGGNQGRCHIAEERGRLLRGGGTVIGEGLEARVCGPAGMSPVSRSLGDPLWKQVGENAGPVLSCIPEIQSFKLGWAERHLCLLLATKPVIEAFETKQLVDTAMCFPAQPRAACGEITTAALERLPGAQCTAVEVWLLAGGPSGEGTGEDEQQGGATGSTAGEKSEGPPKKKAKSGDKAKPTDETKSTRLRHILVRYQEGPKQPVVPGFKAMRTRSEAESLLRLIMRELREELEELRRRHAKKPEELALRSERFAKLCKEHSECPTAQKGGGMCGDLGWVSHAEQMQRGPGFKGGVSVLRPGEYSDIVASVDGLHLIQRIA